MEEGKWKMEDGRWKMENRRVKTKVGSHYPESEIINSTLANKFYSPFLISYFFCAHEKHLFLI